MIGTEKQIILSAIFNQGKLLVIDVVCGMNIDEKTAKWKSDYKGKTYYFCGPMCKLEFDENRGSNERNKGN